MKQRRGKLVVTLAGLGSALAALYLGGMGICWESWVRNPAAGAYSAGSNGS